MKIEKVFSLTSGWVFWKSTIEGAEIVRISPRSYRAGESSGFISGLAIGLVFGVLVMCMIWVVQGAKL